jgi:hypothetical protein
MARNGSEAMMGTSNELLESNIHLNEIEPIEEQRAKIRDFLCEKFNSKEGL